MHKTILIQTDFTEDSLIIIKSAIQNSPFEKLNIVLIHGIHLSDSISDLMFFSKSKILVELSNPAFEEGLEQLKTLFEEHIHSLHIELFSGFNQASFNNFMEAKKVNQIFVSNGYQFKNQNKRSKDLSSFISKSEQRKTEISWARPSEPFSKLAISR